MRTLHEQAVMASAIEHVHRRACCVCGSVLANFGTKTNTTSYTVTLLLVTTDRVLDFPIAACAIYIAVEGREVESAPVGSGSPSFGLKKRNKDISLALNHTCT